MVSDVVIWRNFKAGDHQAFSSIYHTYIQELFHYGCKLTPDKNIVKDSIQDLFIELWNRKEHLGDTTSIKFYLLKCVRRKIIKEVNFVDAEELTDDYHFEFYPSPESEILLQQHQDYQLTRLSQALASLTKRQREAIYLKFYQDMSVEEISAIMSLSFKGTYNLLSKSIVAMRLFLSKNELMNVIKKIAR